MDESTPATNPADSGRALSPGVERAPAADARRNQPQNGTAPRRLKPLRCAFVLAAVALACWGGVWLWEEVLADRVIAKNFRVVVPGSIYRSGQISRWLIKSTLARHGIQVIINLQLKDPRDTDQAFEFQVAQEAGIEQHRCPLGGDGTGAITSYAEALRILHDSESQGKRVLVHCAAGAQRTGGVIAAYRVLVRKESVDDAYAELIRAGWNPRREQILLDYLNSHMAELVDLLVERKVISQVPDPLPVIALSASPRS